MESADPSVVMPDSGDGERHRCRSSEETSRSQAPEFKIQPVIEI